MDTTVRLKVYLVALAAWLGLLGLAHLLIEPTTTTRFVLWLMGAYTIRYLIDRATVGTGSLGAARIGAEMPALTRTICDAAALAFSVFSAISLLN
jgi:hypothetical protein